MDNRMSGQSARIDAKPAKRRDFACAADATGLWFAGAVLAAIAAAAFILYQTSSGDILTASNDTPAMAQPMLPGPAPAAPHVQ